MRWKCITVGRGELGRYWERGQQEIRPLLVSNVPVEQVAFELVERGRAVAPPFTKVQAAKAAAGEA